MLLLKHAQGNADAEKFYKYMLSAPARVILKKYGYKVH
jgi:molybdate transport system substrate-binding protein